MVIMSNTYHKPPIYPFFLLFLFLLAADLCSSSPLQSDFHPTVPPPDGSRSTNKIIAVIGTTATSSFVVAGAFFLCFTCFRAQRREEIGDEVNQRRPLPEPGSGSMLMRYEEIKELIVDEDGLDVLYWKKLKNFDGSFQEERKVGVSYGIGERNRSNRPSLPSGRSSSSHAQFHPGQRSGGRIAAVQPPIYYGGGGASVNYDGGVAAVNYGGGVGSVSYDGEFAAVNYGQDGAASVNRGGGVGGRGQQLPFYSASSRTRTATPTNSSRAISAEAPVSSSVAALTAPAVVVPPAANQEKSVAPAAPPPPPPPAPVKKAPPPPPPPALAKKPPPPPPPGKKMPPGPPKPPSGAIKKPEAVVKEDQVMLKPLHWEKLNVNPDHSMVWDKIHKGSFQYTDDDKMEALFGFVPTNRKSGMEDNSNTKPTDPNARIFILNPKKSRNTAIVLKSLGIPRTELIDSLAEGRDVSIETLEKLARTSLTREEESEILEFDGDATKLADAESFLYNLLKAVPSAFERASAMLFKLNYRSEIVNVKEPLEVMEPACNELRGHGMFLRLLEAILKAGNRLNAGTARGDAKAFNLTTLLKLSDFKSSDGKTTLLSFVVQEVVRSEGRRSLLKQKDNNPASETPKPKDPAEKEEKEKELLRLGLPAVSGLSSELSNVKRAAAIDYDALMTTRSSLKNRLDETNHLVSKCKASGEGGGFLKEMEQFLESAQVEMKALEEEHTRVMSVVTKTTQYYQAGVSNSKNPLLLFTIVKDFLGMLDQACAGIARSLQVKKPVAAAGVTSTSASTQQDLVRTRVIFPGLKEHLLLANKSNVSSDSEDDF